MQSHRKDAEIEFRYYCKDNGIHLYSTIEEAVETWAIENRPLSQQSERMSYIYYAYGSYFYTDVYEGTSAGLLQANVIVPTIALQASRFFDTKYMVAAQVHSHPEPGHGFHNDFPSSGW